MQATSPVAVGRQEDTEDVCVCVCGWGLMCACVNVHGFVLKCLDTRTCMDTRMCVRN
jgi:hypothetical protein